MRTKFSWAMVLGAICLVCAFALPKQVQAAEYNGFIYEVHDGQATIIGTTYETPNYLEIPAKVNDYPVVRIGDQAFEDCDTLLGVVLHEGLQDIGDYAFYSCGNLSWIDVPESLVNIGKNAFQACTNLLEFEFGRNVKTIGEGAFGYCRNLDFYLDFYEGLESIGVGAFYNCDTLETVLLPKSLKELGSKAFAQCDRLDYIYIPDVQMHIGAQVLYQSRCYYYSNNWYWDGFYIGAHLLEAKRSVSGKFTVVGGITTIADNTFENCYYITEISLPEGLKVIGAKAFYSCDGLTSVSVPSSVEYIGDEAFYWCEDLENIQLPDNLQYLGKDVFTKTAYYKNQANWDNNVLYVSNYLYEAKTTLSGAYTVRPGTKTIVDGAMKGLTQLTELTIADSVIRIGNEAFSGCTNLEKVTLADGVTQIGENAFYNCKKLKILQLGKALSQIGGSAFGWCKSLEQITIHSQNATYYVQDNCLIRRADQCLVLGCKTSKIPADGSVTSIGVTAFEGCEGLTELTIPDTILTIGEGAFQNCDGLVSVKLGNGVQVVGKRAFAECDMLAQIDFGQSVHTIDDYGFGYNHQLTRLDFPASLRYLGEEAFSNSTCLKTITFQEGLVSIGKNCFIFSENLTGVSLPDSLEQIKDGAFYSCEKLATLHLGAELTGIGNTAFMGCEALTELTIPAKVQTIGSSAFAECTNLRQVDLGQVKQIGYGAFESCAKLQQVHIPATVTTMGQQIFAYCPSIEQMTVSPQNTYYHAQGNCIINTAGKYLAYGCKNSVIPADGSVTAIDGYSFAGCTGLKYIAVPNQVTRIYAYAFLGCSGLQEMHLPFIGLEDSASGYLGAIFGARTSSENDLYVPGSLKRVVITGGTFLGNSAFAKCTGLQEIVLAESITSAYYTPFAYCSQLQRVVMAGNLQTIKDTDIFADSPHATLYISQGQEMTEAFAQSSGISYRVGGLVTFQDDQGGVMDMIWHMYGQQIKAPAIPEKPSDGSYAYEGVWDPAPGVCTGNQTIQLQYIKQEISYIQGDFNADQSVDNADVIYLLWHTLFPNSYPLQQPGDIDGDGGVNNADVIYLLWHTLFPGSYPLKG